MVLRKMLAPEPLNTTHKHLGGAFAALTELVSLSTGEERRRLVEVAKFLTRAANELHAISHEKYRDDGDPS